MTKHHPRFVSNSDDSQKHQKSGADQGQRDVSFDGFLCNFYSSQYGTDTDDNHQVKDIGTDDITDG